MYIINVKQLSHIAPRMYSVDFEYRPGDPGTTAVLMTDSPTAALKKAFGLFPEYRRRCVSETEHTEIDWDRGRTFVIHAKKRRPRMPNARRGAGTKEKR